MNILMNGFLAVLESQAILYHSLLSVIEAEKKAVVKANLEEFDEILMTKKLLVIKIQILENQRSKMLREFADSLRCPAQDLTLDKLSRLTEAPYSNRLATCRLDLLSLMKRVREANDINRVLLTHSIDLVKGSMSLLDNLTFSNTVYHSSGKIQIKDKHGRIFSGDI